MGNANKITCCQNTKDETITANLEKPSQIIQKDTFQETISDNSEFNIAYSILGKKNTIGFSKLRTNTKESKVEREEIEKDIYDRINKRSELTFEDFEEISFKEEYDGKSTKSNSKKYTTSKKNSSKKYS